MTPRSEQPKEHCEHECVCPDHDGRTGKPCEGILYEPIDEGMNFGSKCPHDTRSRQHPAPALHKEALHCDCMGCKDEVAEHDAVTARKARKEYDPLLDQCKSSLLRAIERSNELHKMAVDGGATPQNQGQFIALLETTIRDIESLRSTQQQAGDP